MFGFRRACGSRRQVGNRRAVDKTVSRESAWVLKRCRKPESKPPLSSGCVKRQRGALGRGRSYTGDRPQEQGSGALHERRRLYGFTSLRRAIDASTRRHRRRHPAGHQHESTEHSRTATNFSPSSARACASFELPSQRRPTGKARARVVDLDTARPARSGVEDLRLIERLVAAVDCGISLIRSDLLTHGHRHPHPRRCLCCRRSTRPRRCCLRPSYPRPR